MLKPPEPGPPPPGRPFGELVLEFVEEGKAYARAEIDLAKAIAIAKARGLVRPAALFLAALIVLQSAVTALAVGIVISLVTFIGPLAAGLVGLLIFAATAGLIGWWGYQRLRRVL